MHTWSVAEARNITHRNNMITNYSNYCNYGLQLHLHFIHVHAFVECPVMTETATVLGAALAAGKGVGLWKDLSLVLNTSSNNFYPRNSRDGKMYYIIITCVLLTGAYGTYIQRPSLYDIVLMYRDTHSL